MAHRFQFNRKNGESVEVEGIRVDMGGDLITVVDAHGQPLMSFDETELTSWYRVTESFVK
jgi:uncharacterized protein YxjI